MQTYELSDRRFYTRAEILNEAAWIADGYRTPMMLGCPEHEILRLARQLSPPPHA